MLTDNIEILYEDADYLVVNKPSGLLVHPKSKNDTEESLMSFMADKTTDTSEERPGIIHRLDRSTSGVMILAKSLEAREYAQNQFAERVVKKEYITLAHNRPEHEEFIIDLPIQRNPKKPSTFRVNINGKSARSKVKIIKNFDKHSLLSISPRTGRTHQIRVHLNYIKCPIVNDILYSDAIYGEAGRLMLHSRYLGIKLLNGDYKEFVCELDSDFNGMIEELANGQ